MPKRPRPEDLYVEWPGGSDQPSGATPSWEARKLNQEELRIELYKLGTPVCNQLVSDDVAISRGGVI